MNITVAKSWTELNEWQLEEIVDLYLNSNEDNWEKTFEKMIIILFQKNKGFWSRLKLWKIIKQVPVSNLAEFAEFLLQPPKIHSFPEISALKKPADRLGDLSIKQFSYMDQFFHTWMDTKSDKFLRALCASIYRMNNRFDEQDLPVISKQTDKLSKKKRQVIGFIYMSCYQHIAEQFPIVYPKLKKNDQEPEQGKKGKFKPFSEMILNIVMNEESQPLGNLHQCNETRIYEFMTVFTKIIIKNKKLEEEYAKRK